MTHYFHRLTNSPPFTVVPFLNFATTSPLSLVSKDSGCFLSCILSPVVRTFRSFCRLARRNRFVGNTLYRTSQVVALRERKQHSRDPTLESTFFWHDCDETYECSYQHNIPLAKVLPFQGIQRPMQRQSPALTLLR